MLVLEFASIQSGDYDLLQSFTTFQVWAHKRPPTPFLSETYSDHVP